MQEPAKAHLLLLLLRTKQKKKWQLEEQFLSIKGYWEFNYLSCEVFQGCGQLVRVIMHGVRGHVHRARGGGCCCSLEKTKERWGKKSLLKLVSRYENSHALCSWRGSLWKQTLFMSLLLLRRTEKKPLWGELLTSGEGETKFIQLVILFAHHMLHKVTPKVAPAGHCCRSDVWKVYGVDGSFLQHRA